MQKCIKKKSTETYIKRKVMQTDKWFSTKGTKIVFVHGQRPNIKSLKKPKKILRAITAGNIIVKGTDVVKLMETGHQVISKGLCTETYYIRRDCIYKKNDKKYTLWQGTNRFVSPNHNENIENLKAKIRIKKK